MVSEYSINHKISTIDSDLIYFGTSDNCGDQLFHVFLLVGTKAMPNVPAQASAERDG